MDTFLAPGYVPADTAKHTAYTVPSGPPKNVSCVTVANRSGGTLTVETFYKPAGAGSDFSIDKREIADGEPGYIPINTRALPGATFGIQSSSASATFSFKGR